MHTQILDRLVAVNLDVRIWSGRKKLTAEDLALGDEVPPEDLVSLGSKRICDPERIRVFHRLKKQAERVCLTGGTRFLGGFAIPEDRAEAVAAELDALGERFRTERSAFVAGYVDAIEDWIAQHPRWQAALRRAVEPAATVESRLAFGYQLFRVVPAESAGNLAEEVGSLGDTLFGEVARMARELDQSFIGKQALSQRALSTFRRIREKLACLAFVDYRVQPVLDSLDEWLARVPAKGPVEGTLFSEGFGLMLLVSDPGRMSDHGAGLLALQELIPAAETEPAADHDEEGFEWAIEGTLGDEEPPVAQRPETRPLTDIGYPEVVQTESDSFYF
mgnify:CR=1 FL=1